MKFNHLKNTPFRFAYFGLPLALLAGSASAQEQSATQARQAAPVQYSVIDLGKVGNPPAQPYLIRDNGLISGAATASDGALHAVLWFEGARFDIGTAGLGGRNSAAFNVSDFGQTVGQAEIPQEDAEDFCGFNAYGFPSSSACVPFYWKGGGISRLKTLGGENGFAIAINDRGQVAGLAETVAKDPAAACPVHQFKPAVWANGKIYALPTFPGDTDGVAAAINDRGQAAGASGTCSPFNPNSGLYLSENHAIVWDSGKVIDLGNLGPNGLPGAGNHACAINNRGEAVGHVTSKTSTVAFLWSKDKGIKGLGTLAGDLASFALGINDEGQVVGQSISPDFSSIRAFVWEKGKMSDLNTLIATNPAKLSLLSASSINAHSEITGLAVGSDGAFHGYLAVPKRK
jgi:probable HAF family extracellular repeat protein